MNSKSFPPKNQEVYEETQQNTLTRQSSHKIPTQLQLQFELDNFYEYILNHNVLKSVKITNTLEYHEESNNSTYTLYLISVKTDSLDYAIQRRFKHFATFYDKLSKSTKQLEIPKFPEKKLFGSKNKKTIESRKEMLNKFLLKLNDQVFQFRLYEFLDFIEIKQQFKLRGIQDLKLRNLSGDVMNSLSQGKMSTSKKYSPQNEEEQMAFSFLEQLNQSREQRVKIFQQMEKTILKQMQKQSGNMLEILLTGDESMKGIIQLLAPTSNEHISCVQGFKFIRETLEFEHNLYADASLKALADVSVKQIKLMNPASHIGKNQSCKNDALYVLHKYFRQNQFEDKFIRFLLEDADAYQEYVSYKQRKAYSISKKQPDYNKQTENEDLDYLSPARIIRKTDVMNSIVNPQSSDLHSYLESEADPDQLMAVLQSDGIKWKLVIDKSNRTMKHIMGKIVYIKYKNLPVPYEESVNLFTKDLNVWNRMYLKYEVIQQINESQRISLFKQAWYKSNGLVTLVFKQFETIEKQDKLILYKSKTVTDANEQVTTLEKDDVLAKCVSIFKFKAKDENTTTVTLITQLCDTNSQVAVSTILLNEDNEFQKVSDKLLQTITQKI